MTARFFHQRLKILTPKIIQIIGVQTELSTSRAKFRTNCLLPEPEGNRREQHIRERSKKHLTPRFWTDEISYFIRSVTSYLTRLVPTCGYEFAADIHMVGSCYISQHLLLYLRQPDVASTLAGNSPTIILTSYLLRPGDFFNLVGYFLALVQQSVLYIIEDFFQNLTTVF